MYKFEKFVLDNGLRLIVSPTDHNEIALWLFIKGGSQHEKKEESGISHFIEHMLFRGTERWPTYKLIDEKTERISQENGAHTDLEETSYFLRVQPRYFNEALDLLSAVRLGVDLGVMDSLNRTTVNELFIFSQPAHLQKLESKKLSSQERDVKRAGLIRNKLL